MNIDAYKANAVKWGRTHGLALASAVGDDALARTYYDFTSVCQVIGEMTGEDFSAEEAAAIKVYRDGFVFGDGVKVPGRWCFTDGLTNHFLRTGDPESKRAVLLICETAECHVSVPPNYPPPEWSEPSNVSREVAYSLIDFMNAEKLGAARHPLMARYFEQALGHYDQWFVSQIDKNVKPFMTGLTGYALIRYYEQIAKDKRILPALKTGADWLWANAWRPEQKGFYYDTDSQAVGGSPDLNMLIFPVFAWTWKMGGKPKYRLSQAQAIFDGGVGGAWLSGPKQFNQSYLRGWEALKWLGAGPTELETLKAENKALKAKILKAAEALK